MKTMNKTCGILAALAAVLLVTAVLVTTCASPLNLELAGYKPPPGKGAILLNFGDKSIGRTILPSGVTFEQYTYSFQEYDDIDGTTAVGSPTAAQAVTASATITVALDPGFYTVTVTGRVTTGGTNGAVGTSDFFEVTAGASTPVPVTLLPYTHAAGTGTGTFTYAVATGGLSATSITRTITLLTGNSGYTDDGVAIALNSGGGTASVTLPSGYYSVSLAMTSGGYTAKTFDILHIYQGLTSTGSYTFKAGQFPGGSGIIITPDWTDPTDTKPQFRLSNNSTLANDETGTITLSIGDGDTETVTVSNAGTFTGGYTWRVNGDPAGTANSALTITAGTAPFDTPEQTYEVTVVGTITSPAVIYAAKFYVVIED